jgi:hypothetical protein
MVFKLFGEITTSYKTTPNFMLYFAIIALNTYGKKLTNTLLAVFKSSDKTVPMITCN